MRQVQVEVCNEVGRWVKVGTVPEEQGGSMSSEPEGGPRDIVHFGWLQGEGRRRDAGGTSDQGAARAG